MPMLTTRAISPSSLVLMRSTASWLRNATATVRSTLIVMLDGNVQHRHSLENDRDPAMLSDDLRARFEKFFGNGRQLFDPQFMHEVCIAAAVREEHLISHRWPVSRATLPMQRFGNEALRRTPRSHQNHPAEPANGVPSNTPY